MWFAGIVFCEAYGSEFFQVHEVIDYTEKLELITTPYG